MPYRYRDLIHWCFMPFRLIGCEKARTETSLSYETNSNLSLLPYSVQSWLPHRSPLLATLLALYYFLTLDSRLQAMTPSSTLTPFASSVTWQILQLILQAIMTLPLCNHFIPSFSFKLGKSNFLHSFPTPSSPPFEIRVLLCNIIWSHVHDSSGLVSEVPAWF